MKLNIKIKILLNGILSVVISIMLVTIIVSILLWDRSEKRARQEIRRVAKVIGIQMRNMESDLKEVAVNIGNQQEYASKANFIQDNEENKALADMLKGERKELAASLHEIAQTSGISQLVIYDTNGKWMCSAHIDKTLVHLGINYPSGHGGRQIQYTTVPLGKRPHSEQWHMCEQADFFKKTRFLPGMDRLPSVPGADREVRGNRLWLKAFSPLRVRMLNIETLKEELVQKGLIQASQYLDNPFIYNASKLTGSKINLFVGKSFSVGNLLSYKFIDQEYASEIQTSKVPRILEGESPIDLKRIVYKDISVPEGEFFEGLVPVLTKNRVLGAFSILLSQEDTRKTQWHMVRSLFLVALLCIVIVTPLTWVMAIKDIIEREKMQKELSRHRDHLEELVQERTTELDNKNIKLNETLDKVEVANKEIMDSLSYAKTIQRSLLADMSMVKTYLPDSFFIWMPSEIVGGDLFHTELFEDGFIVAVIDCTGHGVPGAFMTMIASSALRRVTKAENCHNPGEILKRLNYIVKTSLQQDTDHALSDDGLDAGICFVSTRGPWDQAPSAKENMVLTFAGAKIPLTYVCNDEIKVIKGDKKSIGYKKSDLNFNFTNHTLKIEKGMSFYMATDGFTDQLGGETGLRFGTRHFRKLLKENAHLPFEEQKQILLGAFEEYRGKNERLDDLTVVGFGFRFPDK